MRLTIEIPDEVFNHQGVFIQGEYSTTGWLNLNQLDRVAGLDFIEVVEVLQRDRR